MLAGIGYFLEQRGFEGLAARIYLFSPWYWMLSLMGGHSPLADL